MLAVIDRHGVTNLILASVMLQVIVDSPASSATDLSRIRTVSYGAAPITGQVLHAAIALFQGLPANATTAAQPTRIVQAYGLTETTGVLCVLEAEDHRFDPEGPAGAIALGRLRSCGRPRSGVTLRIVDVHTGDIGYLDADGYLFLGDRLKDMIVSGGENVYPAEVEDALPWHPEVDEVAVIGVPDDKWGETPRAIVVRTPGSSLTADELIAFARGRLAGYKCPTAC